MQATVSKQIVPTFIVLINMVLHSLAAVGLSPTWELMHSVSIFLSVHVCVRNHNLGQVWTDFIHTWHKDNT